MDFSIECEREVDGRWIAEIPELPGAMANGATREEAMARAEAIALRAIAEQLDHP
ncbi:MAG: type II toxin-antitoxin system HicB family antitoxin [Armatimonadetes bacterium]|nr:type II toxin-antitoxin system HicB family antitoxin [Armatimonadota bacterium]